MHDLVIRNGTLVDGTGKPAFTGDLAIDGDRITAVGAVPDQGREEVDARGLLVTPGFVDIHTHYDGQVTWDPWLSPSGWHGVTTVVMGNCGVGFAPVRPADRAWLINVMEGVEDIPGSALSEGIRWEWETFPQYLDAIDRAPHALDFAAQVPHSAVRGYVMGTHASEHDDATPEQIAAMRDLVAEALRAGALGFSTSRTSLHRTAEGVLVAGTSAAIAELEGIADALGQVGHGVFELADEHTSVPADLAWMERIATRTGRPVVFNLSQTDFGPGVWRKVLDGLEGAAERGAPVYGQVAGRAIGLWMGWRATAHPFALHPGWRALAALPWAERLGRLRDPAVRAALLADKPAPAGMFETWLVQAWDKMYPFASPADYEPDPARSVGALARAEGRSPAEVAYDHLTQGDGEGFLYFPLFNYTDGNLDVLRALQLHPRTRMGLSDGGAHCGAICDGGMPTFMLTHWARDRTRGERLPLEWLVRNQTSETADFYGLEDRGRLACGYRADVNVIDLAGLALKPPRLVHDLPAGGRRLIQEAEGYRLTLCAGVVTQRDGSPTGAMPGRLVRGPRPCPG
jgi:N-acyl-D-aspartate/D-glutamate deacylase